MSFPNGQQVLDPETRDFYCRVIEALDNSGIPFLVGGAYAFGSYTGIVRHTKDFDLFVDPHDAKRILDALAEKGYQTETTFPHWLGKAFFGDAFIDVIYSSGNGVATVDADWFQHAEPGEVLGRPVRLIPAEEMIWSKSFVMERERYDGADIMHILRARGGRLDWNRLVRRFGPHWRILLNYLVLFGFVYPGEQAVIPARVLEDLVGRLLAEQANPPVDTRLCQGTLLSREQFLTDINEWHYRDARAAEHTMSRQAIKQWTAAI